MEFITLKDRSLKRIPITLFMRLDNIFLMLSNRAQTDSIECASFKSYLLKQDSNKVHKQPSASMFQSPFSLESSFCPFPFPLHAC